MLHTYDMAKYSIHVTSTRLHQLHVAKRSYLIFRSGFLNYILGIRINHKNACRIPYEPYPLLFISKT
jgi:hypothetical protein